MSTPMQLLRQRLFERWSSILKAELNAEGFWNQCKELLGEDLTKEQMRSIELFVNRQCDRFENMARKMEEVTKR